MPEVVELRRLAILVGGGPKRKDLQGDGEIEFDDSQLQSEGSVLGVNSGQEDDDAENRGNKRQKTKKDGGEVLEKRKFSRPCRFFGVGSCKKGDECICRHG